MKKHLLRLYHRAPAPMRTLAASTYGYYLRYWRYDRHTDRRADAALERESWSLAQWRAWREDRLSTMLHHAATRVPYYRERWQQRRRNGDRAAWDLLENWHILEKTDLRAMPRAFVADNHDPRRLYAEHTSGTTATPLTIWFSRAAYSEWYALIEARWRRWYGVSRRDRWGILGGQLIAPVAQRKPPFWVWNQAFNQLYLSSYHLAPDLIPHYLDAIKRYRLVFLLGYSSSLYALAQTALRLGRDDVRLKVVVSNAEPLYDYQRDAISTAFGCPVRETYGMAEAVAAAGECQHGALHLWGEMGILEVMQGDRPLPPGTTGDLVGTGLLNDAMPLIRYRIGDSGALADEQTACACGRSLERLSHIEGRSDDLLYTADGRRLGRLDPIFKADYPLHAAQIIQESLTQVRLRYVPAPGFTAQTAATLTAQLHAYLGDMQIELEAVESLPRTANGKFRAVVCKLSAEERRQAVN